MLADEVYGALRNYVNQTLVGMGALKGASAQLSNSYDPSTGTNTMTWTWEDNLGIPHTTTVEVHDGPKGDDGIDPRITVKTDTSSTYILTIQTADGSFDTPNLKGPAGDVADLEDLSDVVILSVAAGDIIQYDAATQKWINAPIAMDLEDLTDVAIASINEGDVLQYNATTQKWINAAIATMTGATALLPGTKGLVPAPAAGDNEKLLCGDGTFTDKVLTDSQYAALQTLFS